MLGLNYAGVIKFIVLIARKENSFIGLSLIAIKTAIFSQLFAIFHLFRYLLEFCTEILMLS